MANPEGLLEIFPRDREDATRRDETKLHAGMLSQLHVPALFISIDRRDGLMKEVGMHSHQRASTWLPAPIHVATRW